jgi:hypothetical protein
MNATIYNADYFGFDPIDLDFPCEIHFTRFGNTQVTVHNKHRTYDTKIEKINFTNNNSFKVFVCSNEPSTCRDRETNSNIIANSFQYDLILTSEEDIIKNCDNAVFFPYGGTWLNKKKENHLDSLGAFDESQIPILNKEYNVSFLTTSHLGKPGYNVRCMIWNQRNKIELNTKFYSSTRNLTNNNIFSNTLHDGLLPNDDKMNLFDSMFSIAVESSYEKNYFTEKLIDCLLTKTVPIYWGCPNIGDFFDIRGIIIFNTYEEFLEKINSINEKTYIKMKPYIDANYEKAKEYGRDLFQRVKEEIIKYRNEKLSKTNILWSIGILTVPQRKDKLLRLIKIIKDQTLVSIAHRIELIVISDDKIRTVGDKRNEVLAKANGKYVCFIDDDDLVSDYYIVKILNKLDKEIYDGIGFSGLFYHNEKPVLIFKHSSNYTTDIRENEFQYRFLNHLNPILTEYARTIRFPLINYSEDSQYSNKLKESNLIKNEFTFDENLIMYHYLFSTEETLTGK